MPIAFDATGQAISWATDHVIIDITAAAVGSYVYCAVNVGASQASITFTGWTQVLFGVQNSANSYSLWRRVKQAGDTQFQASWATTTDYPYAVWASYTGLSSTTPELNPSFTDAYSTGTNTTLSTNVSSTAVGQWMLVFNTARSSTLANQPETWTADAALTNRTQGTNNQNKWQILQAADSGGPVATGAHPYTSTLSAAERYKVAMVVVLNPAAAATLTLPAAATSTATLRRATGRALRAAAGVAAGALAQITGHTNGILFVSATEWAQDAGPTGVAYTVPAGTANGNLILALVAINAPSITVTPPTGWARVTGFPTGTSGTTLDAFWRTAASDSGASYNWGFSTAARWVFSYVQYSGASGAPVDTANFAVQSAGGTYPVPTFATTASTAGEWVVAVGLDRASGTASTWSATGGTLRLRSTQANAGGTLPVSMGVFDSAGPVPAGAINSGAVGTALTTNTSISGGLAAIVIRPVIAAVTVLPGASIAAPALGRGRGHGLASSVLAAAKSFRGVGSALRAQTVGSASAGRQVAAALRTAAATAGRLRAGAGRITAASASSTGSSTNGRTGILSGSITAASVLRRDRTTTLPSAAITAGITRRAASGTLPSASVSASASTGRNPGRQLLGAAGTSTSLSRAAAPRLRAAVSATATAVLNRGYLRNYSGAAASAAVLTRAAARNHTLTTTGIGVLIRSGARLLPAAAGGQAALIRAVTAKVSATATASGTGTGGLGRRLATTASATASAVRAGGRVLGAAVGTSPVLMRGVGRTSPGLAGSGGRLGPTGIGRTLAANAVSAAGLGRSVVRLITTPVTGTAQAIRHLAPAPLAGIVPVAAGLRRTAGPVLTATAASAAALNRAAARIAAATVSPSAAITRSLHSVLSATTATTSMIRRNAGSTLPAAATAIGQARRATTRGLIGTSASAGAAARGIAAVLSTGAGAIGTACRSAGRTLAAATVVTATATKTAGGRVLLTTTSFCTAAAVRAAGRAHIAAAATAGMLRRAPGRFFGAVSRADATSTTTRGLHTVLSGSASAVAGLVVTVAASIRRVVLTIGEPFWSWTFGPRAARWRRR